MPDEFEQSVSEEAKALLREEQSKLVKLVEAFAGLSQTTEWGIIKELVFDKALNAIERQLLEEAQASTLSPEKIYRLQGKREWAKQYCDVERYVENLKRQLEEIKRKLR